jgi:hypothetical protein
MQSASQQVHRFIRSEFSKQWDLVLPLSIFSILLFPQHHSIAAYVFFIIFLSLLSFLLYSFSNVLQNIVATQDVTNPAKLPPVYCT